MSWYERFRDALHAKPEPLAPLPPGPSRVRDWWMGAICPCPPLDLVQEARAGGRSLHDYARWHWAGDDLSPEDEAGFEHAVGGVMRSMVAVMAAAEEQGVEWPDVPGDGRPWHQGPGAREPVS